MKKTFSLMLVLALIFGLMVPVSAEGNICFPAYAGRSPSLVDGLNAIGEDSSYGTRAKIAAANGLSGYQGTSEQNTYLLNLLKKGCLERPDGDNESNEVKYYPRCGEHHTSIADALSSIGVDGSFNNRAKIAMLNGFENYCGNSSQNVQLLNYLKQGKLIKSVSSDEQLNENAQNDHICSDYDECTTDGATIYIITKDNCAIRKAAHNKGEIAARGKIGQLISVNRVFQTEKNTRWCEINVFDSDEKLYIFIDNCTIHSEHSYINVLNTDNGYVDFCTVCGVAKAVAENQSVTCGLTCIADQTVKGSFSSYDPTIVSVIAQIIVGEIPGIGTIADARDLIGDIINGESTWVIAADIVALFPLVGVVKYADELSFVAKNADEAKSLKYLPWGRWEDYDKVVRDGQQYVKLGDFYYSHHAVDEFTPSYIISNKIKGVEHSRGISPTYINHILTQGVEDGVTLVRPAKYGRMSYSIGTIDVIVDGDKVVTIRRTGYTYTRKG